ncbi:hypothetical protein HDU93_003535 [Gonapodya sp. JEL0774]|nr:hypothetical protein HDU93_003535 [Gonapodya sp. JEL0774]
MRLWESSLVVNASEFQEERAIVVASRELERVISVGDGTGVVINPVNEDGSSTESGKETSGPCEVDGNEESKGTALDASRVTAIVVALTRSFEFNVIEVGDEVKLISEAETPNGDDTTLISEAEILNGDVTALAPMTRREVEGETSIGFALSAEGALEEAIIPPEEKLRVPLLTITVEDELIGKDDSGTMTRGAVSVDRRGISVGTVLASSDGTTTDVNIEDETCVSFGWYTADGNAALVEIGIEEYIDGAVYTKSLLVELVTGGAVTPVCPNEGCREEVVSGVPEVAMGAIVVVVLLEDEDEEDVSEVPEVAMGVVGEVLGDEGEETVGGRFVRGTPPDGGVDVVIRETEGSWVVNDSDGVEVGPGAVTPAELAGRDAEVARVGDSDVISGGGLDLVDGDV